MFEWLESISAFSQSIRFPLIVGGEFILFWLSSQDELLALTVLVEICLISALYTVYTLSRDCYFFVARIVREDNLSRKNGRAAMDDEVEANGQHARCDRQTCKRHPRISTVVKNYITNIIGKNINVGTGNSIVTEKSPCVSQHCRGDISSRRGSRTNDDYIARVWVELGMRRNGDVDLLDFRKAEDEIVRTQGSPAFGKRCKKRYGRIRRFRKCCVEIDIEINTENALDTLERDINDGTFRRLVEETLLTDDIRQMAGTNDIVVRVKVKEENLQQIRNAVRCMDSQTDKSKMKGCVNFDEGSDTGYSSDDDFDCECEVSHPLSCTEYLSLVLVSLPGLVLSFTSLVLKDIFHVVRYTFNLVFIIKQLDFKTSQLPPTCYDVAQDFGKAATPQRDKCSLTNIKPRKPHKPRKRRSRNKAK
ncbi:uncharacterized protein [Ptychodera flava]|uniref:uncharacterized protein n=1 Tax=Ptychodera flava TaxID=63121 RepID=UPI00396A573A